MLTLPLLDVRTHAKWRSWLAKHHQSSRGVWLVCHKAHTEVESVPYEDLVREALCFGWIDSLVKRLDDYRFAIKVTPRKPASKWSNINRRRWNELKKAGLLQPAGLAAAPTTNTYAAKPKIPELPGFIEKAIKTDAKAWNFFQSLPLRERRNFVVWIFMAKRPETRARRISESIERLRAGQRLGLK